MLKWYFKAWVLFDSKIAVQVFYIRDKTNLLQILIQKQGVYFWMGGFSVSWWNMKWFQVTAAETWSNSGKLLKWPEEVSFIGCLRLLKVVTLKLQRAVEFQQDFELLLWQNIHRITWKIWKCCHSIQWIPSLGLFCDTTSIAEMV